MNANPLVLFLRLSRPLFLLGGALLFALGMGIADFLGSVIDWNLYLLGQLWVTSTQLSAQYLNEYFDSHGDAANNNRTLFSGGSGVLGDGEGQLPRSVALLAATTTLTAAALLTFGLLQTGALYNPLTVTVMSIGFFGAFFYSVPPLRLSHSGYGELLTSVLVANLVPAFAFLLQRGELHRLLAMSTVPLTFLHMAMLLSLELPDYAADIKNEKRNLLVRMGWENGMTFHNLFVLSAYVVLGLAIALGMPAAIGLPSFATLPLGLLQIWYMRGIANGAKPNWRALTLNAVILFTATVYLLSFAFWTR